MENSTHPIQQLSELAEVLLQKLKATQTDITLEFDDVQLQGPGPQGQPGQWRLNGKVSLTSKSNGQKGA
ncbi:MULTISPECIES: hypothetical protein [Rufibacter]|uniref:Uncharacterized protein n=1 Tax=Rufibacter quisquiliarum TaxID=1549639 RepID=A0A839GSU1_9BACT|nr:MULTISPECIES: hypothetical protein [Rufibacter]MBA9077488.1 hypothetical protein [Rufibacter quisquiliarum]